MEPGKDCRPRGAHALDGAWTCPWTTRYLPVKRNQRRKANNVAYTTLFWYLIYIYGSGYAGIPPYSGPVSAGTPQRVRNKRCDIFITQKHIIMSYITYFPLSCRLLYRGQAEMAAKRHRHSLDTPSGVVWARKGISQNTLWDKYTLSYLYRHFYGGPAVTATKICRKSGDTHSTSRAGECGHDKECHRIHCGVNTPFSTLYRHFLSWPRPAVDCGFDLRPHPHHCQHHSPFKAPNPNHKFCPQVDGKG